MKYKSPRLWKAVIFFCLFLLLFIGANKVFPPVWYEWNNYYTFKGFYEEPENSIETVFLGSSVVLTGISPMELYDEYGICSYNLGSENQPMLASCYWLEEAHRLHSKSLKNVVLDCSMLRRVPEDSYYRKALEPMAFSPVKLRALWDYTEGDTNEFLTCLFPFFSYHARWDELTSGNYSKGNTENSNGIRGQYIIMGHYADWEDLHKIGILGLPLTDASPTVIHEEALSFMNKIISFCQNNSLNLILIKTPTDYWSDGDHISVAALAASAGIPFLDFNYTPLYEELEYSLPFDNIDPTHLNPDGYKKFTSVLGLHLTKLTSCTNIRNSELAARMDEQARLYHSRTSTITSLETMGDITAYLSSAMRGDNTILLSIRDEGTWALTDHQRQILAQLGLTALSSLGHWDSYLAVIEKNGITERKKSADVMSSEPLSLTLELSGRKYALKSGASYHGNTSSISIDGVEYSKNQRGINVVVYSNELQEVVHSAVFDTCAESTRDVYSPDMGPRAIASAPLCVCDDPLDYLETAMAGNNIVLIALRDEGSAALTEEQRQRSAALGLPQLSELGYRESYLAVLDGELRTELRGKHADYTYSHEESSFSLKSRSMDAGDTASLCVNGVEYAKNSRGLNILVYNKDLNAVIDSVVFDTCASPVRKPFTLQDLNVYELENCSIYEQAQLYEAARYMEIQRLGGGAA